MKVALIADQDTEKLFDQRLGLSLSSTEDLIAELLRSELAARCTSGRRNLCERVVMLMTPISPVELNTVKEILLSLERSGDITSGPQGQVGATPLRTVKLAEHKYQIFGTASLQHLSRLFTKSRLSVGLARVLELKGDDRKDFLKTIEVADGVTLSAERWAGLDKVGAANQSWLDGLRDRLTLQPRPAGSMDQEARGDWQVYQPDKAKRVQKARWQKKDGTGNGNIWRIWHERGWPIYCWTAGDSPAQQESLPLSADDATRTLFALDKVSKATISCKVSEDKNYTKLQIGGFLPKAEYRYLLTKGKFTAKDGDYFCFQFKTAIWQEVSQLLSERLGIMG